MICIIQTNKVHDKMTSIYYIIAFEIVLGLFIFKRAGLVVPILCIHLVSVIQSFTHYT